MQRELLIFIVLIAIIAALFNFTAAPTEVTASGELNNNDKIVYNAGDKFMVTLDAGQTTDSSLKMNGKSKSKMHPYSEDWDDYGTDQCPDMWEAGDGKCFNEDRKGKLSSSEKAKMADQTEGWDAAKKSDPNNDNWKDCKDNDNTSVCSGDAGWKADMGDGKWGGTEGLDQNKQWDEGERVYHVDNNGTYTESLLTFAWYKTEEIKNAKSGKELVYIGLDGHALNTDACSVKDFIDNECTSADLFVECINEDDVCDGDNFDSCDDGERTWEDSNGMTQTFYAPVCQDFRKEDEKNDNRKLPWILEYIGDDVGSLDINLKVLDYGSYYVNGDNKLMTQDKHYSFDCTRIKQDGPSVGANLSYEPKKPHSK